MASHGIHKLDRQELMAKFRKLLYAKTLQEFETEMESFLNNPLVLKYEKFVAHLRKSYFGRKEKWTMHVRNDLKLTTIKQTIFVKAASMFLRIFFSRGFVVSTYQI